MLVLWDKGFDANASLAAVADTGAQYLGRMRANRRTPVLVRLADGSYLSVLGVICRRRPRALTPDGDGAFVVPKGSAVINASTTAAAT
ncbi:hypothetical protein ACH4VM_36150 [Streptomyces sp. NPDC020792]|uniref:hypothetical protein n=1 Tax=Streptomyces sp. NPDC020792 TaxID=3365089 RepID=UPI003788AA88